MEMSATRPQIARAPFDAVATRYDETFTCSRVGQAQRSAVWRELEHAFRPGDRVLEIGCGTGIDACFLAKRGVRISACDPSSEMIRVLQQRVERDGLDDYVQPCVLGAADIASLQSADLFDGAFSNFGAINCVEDLQKLANDLAGLLKPGASALLCWMGPYCLWEVAWYLAHFRPSKAFRRFRRDGVLARIADGAFVHVRYPSVKFLTRTFSPNFRVESVRGIGVAVPPSYMEDWAERHPRLMHACELVDSWLTRWPVMRSLGDHVLVRLYRENGD